MRAQRRYLNVCSLAVLVLVAAVGTGCTLVATAPVPSTIASPISTAPLASPTLPTALARVPSPSRTRPPSPTSELPTPVPIPLTVLPRARAGQHAVASSVHITHGNTTQTIELHYLLYLPDAYGKDPHKKWPLIMFLHGSDERGQDLDLLKHQPLPQTLEHLKDFPFIVVSPQLPLPLRSWSSLINPLRALLDQLQGTEAVDTQHVYLTGISMGGFGTWEFALAYPKRFAAIAPIAGGYRFGSDATPDTICELKDLPVWVFHGAQDKNVMPSRSEVMVKALQACGGNVTFTLYGDADHVASWVRAYADPKLYAWLLQQTVK